MLCAARVALRGVRFRGVESRKLSTCCNPGVSQVDYDRKSEETLERLSGYFDTFPEDYQVAGEFDVNCAMGVLNVVVSKDVGTYVINKQSPNKQIWLSSPMSGPKRYDLDGEKWMYHRENESLDTLLTREFRKIYGNDDIDFKDHV